MPSSSRPEVTILHETAYGRKQAHRGTVCHYVADTGPLLSTTNPSIVTVHGIASRWTNVARSARQDAIWRYRVRRAISSTDALITVSHSSARDVAAEFNVPESSINVIPHGIDVDKFARPTILSTEATKWRLPKDFVLYLGNIEPRKNVDNLVRAFQTKELRALNIPLVIAGKPAWNYSETMAEIERAQNVIHLGFVSDQDRVALMQQCSLFVFPSHYEGFGFPVLEAMAAGAVVACSQRGSLDEVAGPAIKMVDLTSGGLAQSILSALTDNNARQKCTKAGTDWARSFSWDKSVSAHIDVYRQVSAR
ncbi:glycosyltransferase family 4 protein [Kocuria flava]|uniref:glycosyltransferase family 4 protein n=1 Tax=Kocuria flava TaxID=446860 RepID=UPI00215173E6|nr:glycosyltransferase family 1 protein [Kocuria flava]